MMNLEFRIYEEDGSFSMEAEYLKDIYQYILDGNLDHRSSESIIFTIDEIKGDDFDCWPGVGTISELKVIAEMELAKMGNITPII